MSKHPRPSTFARFGKGLTSRLQNQRIVRHLLTGCPGCGSLAAGLFPEAPGRHREAAARFDYSAAFAGAGARVERAGPDLAEERAGAPGLLRSLMLLPEEDRCAPMEAIETDPAFRTWALCELLQDAAQEWASRDAGRALGLARLGVEVAMRLDPERYGEARVHDLAGRAWAVLGDAERACDDRGNCEACEAAEASFARARKLLLAGTGDPLEEALLLLLEAPLLVRWGRLRDAFGRLDRAEAIGRRLDDAALCGKARALRERLIQGLQAGAGTLPALVLLLKPARLREWA
jgi:hypothetical protein